MSLLELKFIDNVYFQKEYNTAFITDWLLLSDAERSRYIELASTRIQRIMDTPIIELDDLEQEQMEGVQIATSRIIDYWLEYGLDLNRVSGSVSLGTFSASQTVPNDPDYIPENVYEILQKVNLYTPVGYLVEHDVYRPDVEQAITYGVRFKTLERVKWVSLDKAVADTSNKDLHLPTTVKVNELINAKLSSNKEFLGQYPTTQLSDLETDYDAFLKANIVDYANGDTAEMILNDATSPYNGEVEEYIFDGTNWVKRTNNINDLKRTITNEQDIVKLKADKVDRTEGDARYIKQDGTSTFSNTYTPSQDFQATTKKYVDVKDASLQNEITANEARIANLEKSPNAQYKTATRKWVGLEDGTLSQDTDTKVFDLSTLSADDGKTFDFTDKQDLTIWITNDNASNTFTFNFDVKVSTTPQMIEVLREQGSNNVIALFAKLETNGTLTISRNGNTNFELDNIKVSELKEDVLALANGLATKAELNLKQDKQTNLLQTTDKTIVGAINENYGAIGTKQVNVGLKEVALPSGDKVVIKETGHFSSNDVSGVRQEATEDYHLIDLEKANELNALKADKDLSNSTAIKYYKGQILEFNEVKTGTKFEDTTLFTKHLIKDGYTIVGGTDGTETTGEVKSHYHGLRYTNSNPGDSSVGATSGSDRPIQKTGGTQTRLGSTNDVGGNANLPAGIKILKVAYIAKKDISFNEMI